MKTKTCSKCGNEKSINEFYKDKSKKDNLTSRCKECISEYYPNNFEIIKQRIKKWIKNNPEKVKIKNEKNNEYHKNHPQQHRQCAIKYKKNHKNEIKEYFLKYRQINKIKLKEYSKKWRNKNIEYIRKYSRNWDKEKRKTDISFRLNRNMSCAIRSSLKGGKKGRHWEGFVGYDTVQLKQHLERQFKDDMTWELFLKGEIHIDHRIPISIFNITSAKCKGFKACWALENLQPMWAKENISKSNKLFY